MPTVKDVERLANALSLRERIRLVRRLERNTLASRLDAVVTHIRSQAPRLSSQDILRVCKAVRQERSHRARHP